MKFSDIFFSLNLILSLSELRGYNILVVDHTERIQQIFPEGTMLSDLWEDLNEMPEYDRNEICNQLNEAQIIRRYFSDMRFPQLLQRAPRELIAFIHTFNDSTEMELAYGNDRVLISVLPCTIKSENYYIGKLKDYDHYLVFCKTYKRVQEIKMTILTSHLSLKNAGKAAVKLFENIGLLNYRAQIEVHRICASIFQGLESSLVEEYETYDIHFFINVYEVNVQCVGYNSQGVIISYNFFTERRNDTEKTLILQNNINKDIVINISYPENYFVED